MASATAACGLVASSAAAWAAALEYWTAKMHRQSVTYAELVDRYQASQASISRYANRIDEACGIREKLKLSMTLSAFKENR